MNIKNIKKSTKNSDTVFYIFNYCVLFIIMAVTLFPLLNVISNSFSSADAVVKGEVTAFPVRPTLAGYQLLFESNFVLNGFKNSITYTVLYTLLSVTITVMAAFSLANKRLYGRNVFVFLFTFTMFFSGGMIPTYIVIAKYLHLKDTLLAMILPNAVVVWNLIVARTYFQSAIPGELYEAAEMDGCSHFKSFTVIAVPLAKPIIAVLTLYYAVGSWNSFFDALLYLSKSETFPLQLTLRNIVQNAQLIENMMRTGATYSDIKDKLGVSEILKYCLIVVSSGPILMLYPFIQKYFVKGVMIGSLKG